MSRETTSAISLSAKVPESMHLQRLDQVAVALFPDFSRSKLQSWIKAGALTVDGALMRSKDKVCVDQQLQLRTHLEPEVSWSGENIPLDICFEDEHVLVVNKPAGLVVHPAAGHAHGTLVNALIHYAPELDCLPRGGIVHRLDKDTSGIMFVARSPLAHRSLVEQLSSRTVKREYSAVCIGTLSGGGTINEPIGRHPQVRMKMAVVHNGKPALTHYKVAERFANHTAITVNLETGRTHQIRVHMAHRHHPLVGDATYAGRPRIPSGASAALIDGLRQFPRQALHARTLAFDHPASGERVEFATQLPDDLEALLALLRAEDAI